MRNGNAIQNPWMWGGGMIFLGIILWFDPSVYAFFPTCPFHWLTGWLCPGCGSQRALHHLLHLEWGMAFEDNPLLVISIPYILTGLACDFGAIDGERWGGLRNILFGRKTIYLIILIVLCYWIGRNIFL